MRRVHQVIRHVLAHNKGAALDATQVKGFTTEKALDQYMLTHLGKVEAGVILVSPSAANTSFVLQVNTTISSTGFASWTKVASDIASSTAIMYPLQVELTKAIGSLFVLPGRNIDLDISLQPFAHPEQRLIDLELRDDMFLGPFLFISFLFPFVIQMSEVVVEREANLRQSMTAMGMLDTGFVCVHTRLRVRV